MTFFTRILQRGISEESGSTRDADSESVSPPPLSPPQQRETFGVLCLHDHQEATVDIVAIHGLDGDRLESWSINKFLWLKEILAHDIPKSRILTYGYDAATSGTRPLSHQTMDGHANDFVLRLTLYRLATGTTCRPIIFIAHSLGGIILKFALLKANQSHAGHLEDQLDFKLSTYGILFLGTPHQGTANVNLFMTLKRIHSAVTGANVNTKVLQHLERDSEVLQKQLSDYVGISGNFDTKFLYEEYATPLRGGRSAVLVPKSSAVVPGAVNMEAVALHRDHIGLSKFVQRDDDYMLLLAFMKGMINKSAEKVQGNWSRYKRMRAIMLEV